MCGLWSGKGEESKGRIEEEEGEEKLELVSQIGDDEVMPILLWIRIIIEEEVFSNPYLKIRNNVSTMICWSIAVA